MEKNTDIWTLYILGLNMMQYVDQSHLLSYYQIAGIHGVPWIEWNGVAPSPGSENTGYCTHVSELFLTWHRPYLALYEQILFSLIEYIASLYSDDDERDRYQTAAMDFRIPYMDWATQPPAGESVLPLSVGGRPFINASGPNGVQRIANPLYTYLFKPLNATMFIEAPYDLWLTTVRAPTAQDSSAGSNNTAVSLALNQNFPSIQQRLYNLFSNYQNYSTFSNEAWIPTSSSGKYDSLESLHDTIHTLTGLQGHMAWIPFSAFDPIFFLHHAMVDRVFALWQILNPDSWIVPTASTLASYTTAQGEIQDSQTPLTPFYKAHNGTFWTSDDVRDMAVFGYTYDDMVEFPHESLVTKNTTAQAQAAVLINRLYSSSSPASLGPIGQNSNAKRSIRRSKKGVAAPHGTWVDGRSKDHHTGHDIHLRPWTITEAKRPPPSVVVDNEYREWVANIHAKKQALSSTFFIDLFLGVVPPDTTTWSYASNLVGTMSVFASPAGAMAGMDMSAGHTSGTIPLTSALAQKVGNGELASLEPKDVEPYLFKNLHYGIVKADGVVVAPGDVSGLRITIVSSCVQVPSSAEELPRWGSVEDHFDLI
ncbi:hypothetical protein HMPREF1624_06170 [Sporothrix schenckii ATCC 58251]|uniref:Tyrosinase copper-binding domain-containing protein n=1 Tax=Sporothrix schenckii (strain ATCC 58251 / de Perez 2211183) TaxID=1391915 RepID=U7PQY9_SPOS1|nr:hypothetical protein HMPREF1624_06170 [Sporothrix schenckii ATCC 58251]